MSFSSTYQLSAEPLVGLKRRALDRLGDMVETFSRTPRGFEAVTQQYSNAPHSTFSRTPRGFEAPLGVLLAHSSESFSRTPRGFEAGRGLILGEHDTRFQPNPSWV